MTLTSFARMFLLILVRSALTFLFGRFGKAIPPPPYSVFGLRPPSYFILCGTTDNFIFHLSLFGVVDYKTTLRNARKKCKKNKFITSLLSEIMQLSRRLPFQQILSGFKKKVIYSGCVGPEPQQLAYFPYCYCENIRYMGKIEDSLQPR